MNMSETDFFAQSVLHWRRRINGFIEMHGGGGKSGAEGGDVMTTKDFEELAAQYPD